MRELYVSPTGGGTGLSAASPISFAQAISGAQAGDMYWMLEGAYQGDFIANRHGTEGAPIVYRAAPNQRATINGTLQMTGAHNWVWGMEFIDPRHVGQTEYAIHSVQAYAPGVRIINNIINNTGGGIGGWNTGPGHVYYGNIIYGMGGDVDPPTVRTNYPTYTQNSYTQNGYKYLVQNMFFDGRPYDNDFNFHAYTEGGEVSGFQLHQNVFDNGRWVLGGFNLPHTHNKVEENYFYDTPTVAFGYRRPMQFEFINNYLGRSALGAEWVWGDGETVYDYPQLATKVLGNTIVLPPSGMHLRFRTSAHLQSGRSEGGPAIRPGDMFDGNKYAGRFRAAFHADGTSTTVTSLTAWRQITAAAGVEFGANDQEIAIPTTPAIFLTANEYEVGRGHVVVYNWGLDQDVTLDLSDLLGIGDTFSLYHAKDAFSAPVLAGTYSGPVELAMNGEEFGAFLLLSTPVPEPGSTLLLAPAAVLLLRRRRSQQP